MISRKKTTSGLQERYVAITAGCIFHINTKENIVLQVVDFTDVNIPKKDETMLISGKEYLIRSSSQITFGSQELFTTLQSTHTIKNVEENAIYHSKKGSPLAIRLTTTDDSSYLLLLQEKKYSLDE